VSENRVWRRIFTTKMEEDAGGWRKLHNEELHNLHASINIIRVTRSRRIRRAGHVAHMGEMRKAYKVLVGKSEGNTSLQDLGVDGRIILEWIFEK
jgi:hypothetical protein